MSWRWDPTNVLWQAAQNPLQFLDAAYAKSWYAQHSAANWQSGNIGTAILQDALGGYVTTWTGAPASTAQAWWSVGLSVPSFVFSGPVRTGVGLVNTWRGISSALYSSTNALTGGPQINGLQGTFQVIGLGGSLIGQVGKGWPAGKVLEPGGQYIWRFASETSNQTSQTLSNISENISAFRFVTRVGDATYRSFGGSPGATATPQVGGILFENCAATLTGIGELIGAYWDTATASVVLVGRDSATGEKNSLPLLGLDQEHFLVAMRAALAGQPLGVSIDPPAEFRDGIMRGVTPPDGTPMLVSYLGNCEGTLFGAILFEADRLLKCLDKGVHNETRKSVRATVPGFQPLLEMARPGDQNENVWHRFWFVVDKVELKHDAAENAIVFGDVRLKVLTETEMDGRAGAGRVDPNDNAFALHLTNNYDAYARDFPILARLKELAKITSVAKLLAKQKLPLDLGALFGMAPLPTTTPSFTPGISVTSPNVETTHEGNVIRTRTVSMFGGVDMDPEPVLLPDRSGEARALRQRVEGSRPVSSSRSWTISEPAGLTRAVAMSLAKPQAPFSRVCIDHQFPRGCTSEMMQLCRVYDSSHWTAGDFGPGWRLWTPISLKVISSNGKRSEVLTKAEVQRESSHRELLLLHNQSSNTTSFYRPIRATEANGTTAFARVTGQTTSNGAVSFQYDPADLIHKEQDGYRREEGGLSYVFGRQGQLEQIQQNGRWIVRYHWRDKLPARIESADGCWYEFSTITPTDDRISMVRASDGTTLHYTYDREGCLRSCQNGKDEGESYACDLQQRLVEVRDSSSCVIARAVYAPDGDQIVSSSDSLLTEDGGRIWRTFDQGRLVQATDQLGGKAAFEYGPKGELAAVRISEKSGRTWQLAYDCSGWIASFENPFHEITRFEHTVNGQLNRVATSRGENFTLDWDSNARLTGWQGPLDQHSQLAYDDSGRLIEIYANDSRLCRFAYAGPMLLRGWGPAEAISVSPRKHTLTVKHSRTDGWWEEQTLDRDFRLTKVRSRSSGAVRLNYGPKNGVCRIQNEAGVLNFEYHRDRVTVGM